MDTTGSTGPARLADALREYAVAGFSGALQVDGQPGGCFYLAGGAIAGCEAPGAPGLVVIALRLGRVTEADWNAAFSAAAVAGHPLTDELAGQGLLGAGEAEALLRVTLADAVFAVLSGTVDGWAEAPAAGCQLPLVPPARPGWLLAESTRRSQALAGFAGPVIGARDRVAVVPGLSLAGRRGPGPGQGEILALADGRRTVRDLAFALGRGLYETLLDVSRMRDANLVSIAVYAGESAPRDRASGIASDRGGGGQTTAGLPRRRTGQAGPRPGEAGRRDLAAGVALLRPRATGGTNGAPGERRELQGGSTHMVEDALLTEMRALQDKVAGIKGTAVASLDGLIVRADTGGTDPDNLAALAATWLSLAQRMSTEVGQGSLREAMTRSSGGSVTIYAIGGKAVLVLIGDEGLDTARLRRESQPTLDAIGALIAGGTASARALLTR